jgi:hypothetical protein
LTALRRLHKSQFFEHASENKILINYFSTQIIRNNILTDFVKALPDNSSVNTVQHTTIEEAVFSSDPTDAPMNWLNRAIVRLVELGQLKTIQ